MIKSLDLQPTPEQIKLNYCKDTIGRNADLHKFVEILNSLEGGCSIALDGNWGSGKTFFVKQTKIILDAHNEFITSYKADDDKAIPDIWQRAYGETSIQLKPQICIYYDAWENDNDDDPLLSIIYEILQTVETDYSFKSDLNLMNLVAAIIELGGGVKIKNLLEAVKQEQPFSSIKSGRDLKQSVSEFFESLLSEQGDRLIIFIDELDRCTPRFAIKLLERLKHYFYKDNITFVLSVNSHELQNTIKQYYGNDFDAYRYMDRFFDLRITLPPVNLQNYFQSFGFTTTRYTYDSVAFEVIRYYHFELREIAKYLNWLKIAACRSTHDSSFRFSFSDGKALQFCLTTLVPIMLGLKMYSSNLYNNFIEGKDFSPLIEILGKNDCSTSICRNLLEINESFEESSNNEVTVKLNDKLIMVYKALFVQAYSNRIYEIKIGETSFSVESKKDLLKIISLLSDYSDYT